MKISLKNWLFIVLTASILASCKILYVPNTFNSPLLRNKGDMQLNALIGIPGIEAQTALAVTDRIGLMANGQLLKQTNKDSQIVKRTLIEGGIGYTERFSDKGIFEIFAGGGVGSVPAKFRDQTWDGVQTATLKRYFVQPALGFCNDWLDFSIVSRLSLVDIGPQRNWFYEPGIVSKLGYKRLRVLASLSFSIPFRKAEDRVWDNMPVTFSVGMHFNFGKRRLDE